MKPARDPERLTLLALPRAQPPLAGAPAPLGGRARPSRYAAFRVPQAPLGAVLARFARWFAALARVALAVRWDALLGRDDPARRARRARRAVEAMGPIGIRTAQQVAMRLDLLPLEYAAELARLQDAAPPMDLAHAVARIRAATGGPLAEVFEAFDPEPIVADALSCVYQATLRGGPKVAVKVRRPAALAALAVEHAAVDLVLRALGWLGDARGHVVRSLRAELLPLLTEGADFTRVARLQRIFRREARKDRLGFVSAARVFARLSGPDVIVSAFVSGVWLDEVLGAQERRDPAALAALRAMEIDPARCGRRLLHACWWGFFEALVFAGLPRASQIVVEPGGRLTFVDLGTTGSLSQRHRRLLARALERLADYDVEGAVELFLQLLMPMPPIDLDEFGKAIERRIWDRIFALDNLGRPWWERTGTALWLAVLETARAYRVPVRIELSRMMQAACLYDHLAARLWPRFRLFREFRRYRARQHERQARRAARTLRKQGEADRGALAAQARRVLDQAGLQLESLMDNLPLRYSPVIKKASYSTSQMLLMLVAWAKVGVVLAAVRLGYAWATTGRADPVAAARWVAGQAVFYGVGLVLVVLTIRRVLFRLNDVDRRRA